MIAWFAAHLWALWLWPLAIALLALGVFVFARRQFTPFYDADKLTDAERREIAARAGPGAYGGWDKQ